MKKIIILLCLGLSACSSKPQKSDRTFLEKMNGNSYESTNNLALIAPVVLTEKPVILRGTGQLYCGEGIDEIPAQQAEVILMNGKNRIATTTSDQYGQFDLTGKFVKEKNYTLKIKAKCGSSEGPIKWTQDVIHLHDIVLKK